MEKPSLYRFRFDEDTGVLSADEIKDYSEVVWYGKREYRYKLLGTVRSVRNTSLDRYLHNQVHSFDPDAEHAKGIINENLEIKARKAKEDYERYTELMSRLKEGSA